MLPLTCIAGTERWGLVVESADPSMVAHISLYGVLQPDDAPLQLCAIARGCHTVPQYSHASATRAVPSRLPVQSRSLRAPASFLQSNGSVLQAAERAGPSL